MTPQEIKTIADRRIDVWMDADPNQPDYMPLRESVYAAITEALALDYERRCLTGTPPHDLNNPPFQRHCGPQHDQE